MDMSKYIVYRGSKEIEKIFFGSHEINYKTDVINTEKVRYIRDWITRSNVDQSRHWLEIEALDSETGTNVALGKTVTCTPGYDVTNGTTLQGCVDGNHIYGDANQRTEIEPADSNPVYVQIDLGKAYDLDGIIVWHNYSDSRKYYTKLEVSEDGTTWKTLYNCMDGKDPLYAENESGKVHIVKPLTYPKNGFRYVRESSEGNSVNNSRDWTSLQVLTADGTDLAIGKTVTLSDGYTIAPPTQANGYANIDTLIDGTTKIEAGLISLEPADGKQAYVQVDLGKIYKPDKIKVCHNYNSSNTYNNRLYVSEDGFTWYKIYDYKLNGHYTETSSGKDFLTPYVSDKAKPRNMRYVRWWVKFNSQNAGRHLAEIEVNTNANSNIVLGKYPTFDTHHQGYNSRLCTDGSIDTSHYTQIIQEDSVWAYAQFDLEQSHTDIANIQVWHYALSPGRAYTYRLEYSSDSVNWYQVWNSYNNGIYQEPTGGKVHSITFPKVPYPPPGKLSVDDVNDVIIGLATNMEYSYDAKSWIKYTGSNPPNVKNKDITVYVRFSADDMFDSSSAVELTFTKPEPDYPELENIVFAIDSVPGTGTASANIRNIIVETSNGTIITNSSQCTAESMLVKEASNTFSRYPVFFYSSLNTSNSVALSLSSTAKTASLIMQLPSPTKIKRVSFEVSRTSGSETLNCNVYSLPGFVHGQYLTYDYQKNGVQLTQTTAITSSNYTTISYLPSSEPEEPKLLPMPLRSIVIGFDKSPNVDVPANFAIKYSKITIEKTDGTILTGNNVNGGNSSATSNTYAALRYTLSNNTISVNARPNADDYMTGSAEGVPLTIIGANYRGTSLIRFVFVDGELDIKKISITINNTSTEDYHLWIGAVNDVTASTQTTGGLTVHPEDHYYITPETLIKKFPDVIPQGLTTFTIE